MAFFESTLYEKSVAERLLSQMADEQLAADWT